MKLVGKTPPRIRGEEVGSTGGSGADSRKGENNITGESRKGKNEKDYKDELERLP